MEEKEALIFLNHIPSFNSLKVRRWIHVFGSAKALISAPAAELARHCGDAENIAEAIICTHKNPSWKEDMVLVEKEDVKLISFQDPEYPSSLLKLPDFPLLLYIKGKWDTFESQGISIVGTRQCSLYGKEMAYRFAEELAALGFTVISGLARGIDTAAHLGALQSGRTLAILGSGISRLYPKENLSLAKKIEENGALLSEFPMACPPQKHLFPKRNRLVSALGLGTLLIEAPVESGAMITMKEARKQEKKCFAIPGRIDVESFRGNHFLLKNQKAFLVENPQEMLSILLPEFSSIPKKECSVAQTSFLDVDEDEKKLLHFFSSEEMSLEQLMMMTQLPIAKLNSLLMSLVLKEIVREFPGKIYKKCGSKVLHG